MNMTTQKEGMETLTSMFLLMISALLIFGVLTFLHPDGKENNDMDLIKLRSFQVKCLGQVLASSYIVSLGDIESDEGCSDIIIVWDGEEKEVKDQGNPKVPLILRQALSTTPDGMTSVLIVGEVDPVDIEPAGEYVSWSNSIKGGTFFRVYLSIHAGSLSVGGLIE